MPHDHQFPRVFISYSRHDGAGTAARLRGELESLGISLWQDLTAMQGGQDWWRQIQQATDKAEYLVLVLVLTPGALASKVCKDESPPSTSPSSPAGCAAPTSSRSTSTNATPGSSIN
jgi:hypothetical protein